MKAAYCGMVSQLDWQLGLTLDRLKELGLEGKTIVVFTSDHGEFLGEHGIPAKAPFLLDCMLHVPCMIRVPGGLRGGSCHALAESVDLFGTLARLSGCEPPRCIQGRDLSPLVMGSRQNDPAQRRAVCAEAVDKKCMRTEEWKYIHYPEKAYGELYHLTEDPYELDNLCDQEVKMREKMRKSFYDLIDETEDFRHPSYQTFTGMDPETGEEITHYHTW